MTAIDGASSADLDRIAAELDRIDSAANRAAGRDRLGILARHRAGPRL